MIELSEYITVKECLSLLDNQVKRGCFYNWIKQNKIQNIKLGGKVLVHKPSLIEFVDGSK